MINLVDECEKEAEETAKNTYIHHFDDDINYPEVLKAITVGVQKGSELGYNKGYHDAEEHYMQVIDNQHKLVDESKKEVIRLLERWIDTRPYTVSEQKDLIAETEQFLILSKEDD